MNAYDDSDYGQDITCNQCHGEGWLSICWDDLCHNDEGCIHGDGNVTCWDCNGSGHIWIP